MVEYRKYMFDNFVVEDDNAKTAEVSTENSIADQEPAAAPELVTETVSAEEIITAAEQEPIKTQPEEIPPEEVKPEPENKEPSYSKEELDAAIRLAEEKAYEKGFNSAAESEMQKSNILLGDIKEQLSSIFAEVDKRMMDVEKAALNFAVETVRKILPTLERERAEAEVKNFLSENFANFAAQDTLSFAFNPETVPLVADSIGRLAEQNDFEGRIAVHKDGGLGVSDCRVEWKNGSVERRVSKILDKVDAMINDNTHEGEDGKQ